jgi:hypothetical protein
MVSPQSKYAGARDRPPEQERCRPGAGVSGRNGPGAFVPIGWGKETTGQIEVIAAQAVPEFA